MREHYYFCAGCGNEVSFWKVKNDGGDTWYHKKNSTKCGPVVSRKRKVKSPKQRKKK